jgi:hypothetical protein
MPPGTVSDAIVLAKQRWSQVARFDLDETTWKMVMQHHEPCDVLQAIHDVRKMRHGTDPAKTYAAFERHLTKLTEQRSAFREIHNHFLQQE